MGKVVAAIVMVAISLAVYTAFSGDGFDPKTIKNKRVLITGASAGIGEQLAYYYSKLGARLVITARSENLLKIVSKKCKELGAQQVEIVTADMSKAEGRIKVIEQTEKHLGGLSILILNHAQIISGFWDGSPANFTTLESIFQVNFLSYVDLASRSLQMLKESKGAIGVVSSGFGEIGVARLSYYSPPKFALHGFFAALRQELRYKNTGISVTIVVLGPVASDFMIRLKEVQKDYHISMSYFMPPEEAAKVILESVSQRYYTVRHTTFINLSLYINDLFPNFAEDFLSDIMLNVDGCAMYLYSSVAYLLNFWPGYNF